MRDSIYVRACRLYAYIFLILRWREEKLSTLEKVVRLGFYNRYLLRLLKKKICNHRFVANLLRKIIYAA